LATASDDASLFADLIGRLDRPDLVMVAIAQTDLAGNLLEILAVRYGVDVDTIRADTFALIALIAG
jgi:hypothetical protein